MGKSHQHQTASQLKARAWYIYHKLYCVSTLALCGNYFHDILLDKQYLVGDLTESRLSTEFGVSLWYAVCLIVTDPKMLHYHWWVSFPHSMSLGSTQYAFPLVKLHVSRSKCCESNISSMMQLHNVVLIEIEMTHVKKMRSALRLT